MTTYKCEFPECNYSTESRTQIHYHHIVPKELGGNNRKNNRLFLCPNCHTKIFIPEAKVGIHSIKHENSIVIVSKLISTAGMALQYISEGTIKYHFYL